MAFLFRTARGTWEAARHLGAVCLLLLFCYHIWSYVAPHHPQIAKPCRNIVRRIIPRILEDIAQTRKTARSALVLRFRNDPSGWFTRQLRLALITSGVLAVQSRTFVATVEHAFGFTNLGTDDFSVALAQAKSRHVDAVVFGTVARLDSVGGITTAVIQVSLADAKTSQLLFTHHYTLRSPLGGIPFGDRERGNYFYRLLIWALTVLLIPVTSFSFIRDAVRRKSNSTNAFVLGVYTLLAGLVTWLLLGFLTPWWLLFWITAIAYIVKMMAFALRLEEN